MANEQNDGATATASTFRLKAGFMKSWKPASAPSNRDRLELYALHKQAVSGDAPMTATATSSMSVGDRAKYQAWRGKRGLTQAEAMSMYCQECDRQVRVYGASGSPQTPTNTPSNNINNSYAAASPLTLMPRGLAAIPLLCAAAAESRSAYLRRLARTSPETAWWSRQEALCASPGALWALPETILIAMASLIEWISISFFGQSDIFVTIIPISVIQSFLWPLHNCFLSLWMALILIHTALGSAFNLLMTMLWGSQRTGISLEQIWTQQVRPAASAANSLCEAHQPMSTRLVGLALHPYGTFVVGLADASVSLMGILGGSFVYCVLMLTCTWWYWLVVVPWLAACLLMAAAMSGSCFALIDFAGI